MSTAASSDKGLAKAAGFIMVMIAISRLTGFLREVITAHTFGRGRATDAFFAAFTVPDMMYFLLIGGALSSAFIPVFTSYLAKDDEEAGWEAASTFINVTVLLLLTLTIIGFIGAPLIAPLVAFNFHGAKRILLIHLIRFMFPAVFFTALAGLQMGILNSYRDFLSPTLGPIIYNVGIILGTLLLGHRYGVYGMAVGVVAGALGNVMVQVPNVLKHNKGYRFKIDLNNPGYRRMLALMLPTLIGLSVTQINLVINQNVASTLSEGSISALRYANRIMQLPLGIFAMGIAQAFFPTMSRYAARGENENLRATISLGLRSIFFVTVPSAVALIVLRVPIIQVLFQQGAFKASDTRATAGALLFYSLGLVAASSLQVLNRAFYSLHDTSTPVKTGIAMVVLNFALNMFFLNFTNLKHSGLALAFSIDGTINMILLLYILSRKLKGFDAAALVASIAKSLVASLFMGAVIYGAMVVGKFLTHSGVIRLGLDVVAGVVSYLIAGYLLKMEELTQVAEIFKRKRTAKR